MGLPGGGLHPIPLSNVHQVVSLRGRSCVHPRPKEENVCIVPAPPPRAPHGQANIIVELFNVRCPFCSRRRQGNKACVCLFMMTRAHVFAGRFRGRNVVNQWTKLHNEREERHLAVGLTKQRVLHTTVVSREPKAQTLVDVVGAAPLEYLRSAWMKKKPNNRCVRRERNGFGKFGTALTRGLG